MIQQDQDLEDLLLKAQNKLRVAKLLLANQEWEDAAAKAYYAVFHAISAVLKSQGMTYSSHGRAIGSFNQHFIKTGIFPKEYGRRLSKLEKDREAGDYRTKSEIGDQIAREDVQFAEEILEGCKKYLGGA